MCKWAQEQFPLRKGKQRNLSVTPQNASTNSRGGRKHTCPSQMLPGFYLLLNLAESPF